MFGGMISWLNRKLEGGPTQSGTELYHMLKDRSSAEIAARLLSRADIFASAPESFFQRCAAMDRVAAEQIERIVRLANPNKDIQPWLDARDKCLAILQATNEDKH